MSFPLRILLLEDREEDIEIIRYQLKQSGFNPDIRVADNQESYIAQLNPEIELILADYNLPQFNAPHALSILQEREFDIPFIIVSGAINEEAGVACMRQGADDYILKDHPARLEQAIVQALDKHRIRKEKQKADQDIKVKEARFRALAESVSTAIFMYQDDQLIYVNPAAQSITGYTDEELCANPEIIRPLLQFSQLPEMSVSSIPTILMPSIAFRTKQQQIRWLAPKTAGIDVDNQKGLLLTAIDITDQKLAEDELNALYQGLSSLLQVNNLGDIQEIAKQICIVLEKALPATKCYFGIVHDERNMEWITNSLYPASEKQFLETATQSVLKAISNKTLISEKFSLPLHADFTTIVTPLVLHQTILGVLWLQRPSELTPSDKRILDALAERTAQVLEAARLQKQNEQMMDQLLSHHRFITVMSKTSTIEGALEILCEELVKLSFDYVFAAWENPQKKGNANILVEYPLMNSVHPLKGLEVSGFQSYFANHPHPLMIQSAEADNPFHRIYEILSEGDIQTIMMIPLWGTKSEAYIYGFIGLCSYRDYIFSIDEQDIANVAVLSAMQVMENSTFSYSQIREKSRTLEDKVSKQNKEVLRLNERLTKILNNVSDSILLLYADGRLRQVNWAFDKMFGYSETDIHGLNVIQLCTITDQPVLEKTLREAFLSRQEQRIEVQAQHKNGKIFDIDIALAPILPEDNDEIEFEGLVCSIRDITKQKTIERMQDNFIQTVSHELRTPLQAILMSASVLDNYSEQLSAEKIIASANRIYDQSLILLNMIEDILTYSKLVATSRSHDQSNVEMTALLKIVLDEINLNIKKNNLQLHIEMDNKPIWVTGIYTEFVRLWHNLIDNAIKYTLPNGQVAIRLGVLSSGLSWAKNIRPNPDIPSEKIMVGQVEDSGMGISEDEQELIFMRFYRGKNVISKAAGAGLGLALVKEIITHYGGEITLSSSVERGSIFTFWLPIVRNSHD